MSQYKELQKRINAALGALGQFAETHQSNTPPATNPSCAPVSVPDASQKEIEKILNENAVFTNRNRVLHRKLEEQEAALKALSRRLSALDEVQNGLAQKLADLTPDTARTLDEQGQEALWQDLLKAEQLRLAAFKDEAAVVLAALNEALALDAQNSENRPEGDA